MTKNELRQAIADKEARAKELAEQMKVDDADHTAVSADMVSVHAELDDLGDQLAKIVEAEALAAKQERAQEHAEIAQGSEIHVDFASDLWNRIDGDFDALEGSNGGVEIDAGLFVRDVLRAPSTDDILRPGGGTPTQPTERVNTVTVMPYQTNANPSFVNLTPTRVVSSPVVPVIEIEYGTSRPANKAEGAEANEYGGSVTTRNVTLERVPFEVPVTRQSLRDISGLRANVIDLLTRDVNIFYDGRIRDAITGASGIRTKATEAAADKIYDTINAQMSAAEGTAHLPLNAVCMNRANWGALRKGLATTSDRSAVVSTIDRRLDDVPVVITPSLSGNKIVAGAFVPAAIENLVLENPRLYIGTSGADFSEGKVRLQIEMEAYVVVKIGQAFAQFKDNPANTGGWF